ncbi:MAG: outer membrane protein assembly factor BamE [Gammaproteobacteria bacterium]
MIKKLTIALIFGLVLSGCSIIRPYHPIIKQGNKLDATQVAKVHTGMTKQQVISILGKPVLTNAFDTNRFDYVYTYQNHGGPIVKQKMSVFFKHGIVSRIEKSN